LQKWFAGFHPKKIFMLWTDIQYSITTKFWLVEIQREESQKSFSHLNWKIDLWIDQIKHTIIFIDYMNYSFLARLTQSHVKYCHHFVSVLSIICKLFTLSSSFPKPLVQLKVNFVGMFVDHFYMIYLLIVNLQQQKQEAITCQRGCWLFMRSLVFKFWWFFLYFLYIILFM
jgi:hypothetical protein